MSLMSKKLIGFTGRSSIFGPAAIIFISANLANAANLLFNMLFARLMGPALFADLTLLLTLKLGVLSFLSALQFAYSEHTAKQRNTKLSKIKAQNLSLKSLKLSFPIMFIVIASASTISSALNFSSPLALSLLALAIPFFLPMVIYRGLTQGLIDVHKIVFSIQAEWVLRLAGSLLLWKMGFGLSGISVAVGLSIIAAFICSTDKSDWKIHKDNTQSTPPSDVKTLTALATPYLILQAAQVFVLDSDIVIAKIFFSAEAAGLVAGLLLIQRIFFFAFLSCSTVLQPHVAGCKNGQSTVKDLLILLSGISILSVMALIVIIPNSEWLVKIMLGKDYHALASIVWISGLTGAIFTISHLCAIYQIAKGQKLASIIVLTFGILQLISLSVFNHLFPNMDLHSYFSVKLAIQTLCAACLLGTIVRVNKRTYYR